MGFGVEGVPVLYVAYPRTNPTQHVQSHHCVVTFFSVTSRLHPHNAATTHPCGERHVFRKWEVYGGVISNSLPFLLFYFYLFHVFSYRSTNTPIPLPKQLERYHLAQPCGCGGSCNMDEWRSCRQSPCGCSRRMVMMLQNAKERVCDSYRPS
ncbi:hypothetical protein SAMN05443507_10323 [Alicyclobacillus tolerans]|uniref:Uncharacterized protein n=1 Tax=Alicyclobacillus tolerans TaxID=90970 RepID=A0A1M6LMW3_9BACL|nr:hypothetical protein SAMN05443507_10323 [Alicyclobacillus montanus]